MPLGRITSNFLEFVNDATHLRCRFLRQKNDALNFLVFNTSKFLKSVYGEFFGHFNVLHV